MDVFESLSYGYPSSDAGFARARLRTQAWDAQARRYLGVGALRWIDAGSKFELINHPRHASGQPRHREFVAIELRWQIENNVPIGCHGAAFPNSLQRAIADAKAAHGSRFATKPHAADGVTGFFVVELEAQPATVEYRSPFEHRKPVMHIEHARAVAPQNEEAWADALNRIRVRYAWDRQTPEGAFVSSPLLLSMQADTGKGYGGVHVPRAGEWLVIDHWGGDCDRPFILGRLNGGMTEPPWHTNVLLSGFRSRGFGNIAAGKSLVMAAAGKISLFVQQAGMKLFAANGKVEVSAQSDEMQFYADQDMTLTSNRGRIILEAKQELMLKCGGSKSVYQIRKWRSRCSSSRKR